MRPTVEIKEELVVASPATSSVVAGTGEASQTLKKGPWTAAEDAILIEYVKKHGEGNWNAVQKNIGLQRCGKSCRLRWANHLRPNLKKGSFSPEEESLILRLHARIGNKWARMAAQMPGRTDNEIKNYWNTRVKRRQRAGLPLYPPEIQCQEPIRTQKSGMLMFHQNQIRPKNFISCISPSTTTLFNPDPNNNNSANYLLGNFNFNQPPQQLQSPAYPVKMEQHPLTPLFTGCPDDQKPQPPPMPPTMEQENNNALLVDLFQESQGPGEMYNEGSFFEPLSASCTVITESSSSPQIDPLCKMDGSNFPIGFRVMKQPVERMVNQDVSNMPEMNPVRPTAMPVDKLLSEWCDFSQPSRLTEDDLRVEMQQLATTLSMAQELGFVSSSWESMPSIR